MAINIDRVYQKVLHIMNKEQRGYVTPLEFNNLANLAQLDLFEQYFYDINQFGRVHGNDTEYSDMLGLLNEKISIFETTSTLAYNEDTNYFSLPENLYRLGTVIYTNNTVDGFGIEYAEAIEAERINKNEILYINSSPLTKPRNTRPICSVDTNGVKVYGDSLIVDNVSCNYIRKPASVRWAYTIVFDQPLYNAINSVDFELHPSEEVELVHKILELAGVMTKNMEIYQVADKEEMETIQQQKS
jgi:hypothetical protein